MENNLRTKLRTFYKCISSVYGEHIAQAMSIEKQDIKESLDYYSSYRFQEFTTEDIYKELIKNELLSNNSMTPITRKLVEENNIGEIFGLLDSNEKYKSTLVRAYINNSERTLNYDSIERESSIIDSFNRELAVAKVLVLQTN
jgi:hypothetical protein